MHPWLALCISLVGLWTATAAQPKSPALAAGFAPLPGGVAAADLWPSAAPLPAASGAGGGGGRHLPGPDETIYQIWPASFADSDGDGIGDLRGILGKVEALRALGVSGVWLSGVLAGAPTAGGEGIGDFYAIDPLYGSLEDWRALRDALHARGIQLLLELSLGRSAAAHPWYVQEVAHKTLQATLMQLIRGASAADARAILALFERPAAAAAAPVSAAPTHAVRALAAYLAQDDGAAVALGYPCKSSQLAQLHLSLQACAGRPRACAGLARPFDDFYLWRDGPASGDRRAVDPAWRAVVGTGGWALSSAGAEQMDLNWRSPAVRAAMAQVVSTWERRGADGFGLASVDVAFPNPSFFGTEPRRTRGGESAGGARADLGNLPPYLRALGRLDRPGESGEAAPGEAADPATGTPAGGPAGAFVVPCPWPAWPADPRDSAGELRPFALARFKRALVAQQRALHGRASCLNALEGPETLRLPGRLGEAGADREAVAKLFAVLLMTLEGTPSLFQGQEIGMTGLPAGLFKTPEDIQDLRARADHDGRVAAGQSPRQRFALAVRHSRDHVRSAMQWSALPHAGFSAHPGRVRINPNSATLNVHSARQDPRSIWHAYRTLIDMRRRHPSWAHGRLVELLPEHPQVFAYMRTQEAERTLVLLNFSGMAQSVDLPPFCLPQQAPSDRFDSLADAPALGERLQLRPWEARLVVSALPAAAAPPTAPYSGSAQGCDALQACPSAEP